MNKKKLEEVLDLIDASHEIENIKQIAHNSKHDNIRLSASTKLLEIVKVIKNDGGKVKIDVNNLAPDVE